MRRSTIVGAGVLVVLSLAGCGSSQDQLLGVADRPLAIPAPIHAVAAAAAKPAAAGKPAKKSAAEHPADPSRKVTVGAYADDVCAGLAQFGVAFHEAKAKRTAAMSGSPAQVRTALLGFYDAMDSAFDSVVLASRRAGVPKLSHGKNVASGVVSTLGAARKAGDKHRSAAQALDPNSKKSVRTVAQQIAGDTDRDVVDQMRLLARYDSDPAVRAAFTQAPSCHLQKH